MAGGPFPGIAVDERLGGDVIASADTSTTAFVGRARRGPVTSPVTVRSFSDFERVFGGLWSASHLGYSVRDFFANGGGRAVVVRVHVRAAGDTATLTLTARGSRLRLVASSPGTWGSRLEAVLTPAAGDPSTFALTVTDTATGVIETFPDLSVAEQSVRRVDVVVDGESTLVRVARPLPASWSATAPVHARTARGISDGAELTQAAFAGALRRRSGGRLPALDAADPFGLLVIPPYRGIGAVGTRDLDDRVLRSALAYARARRVMVIADPPSAWSTSTAAIDGARADFPVDPNLAVYFPRLREPDPSLPGAEIDVAPSGAVAGIIARTDANRGVWTSPAGTSAVLQGVVGLGQTVAEEQAGALALEGVNCLRFASPGRPVVWGSRTRSGADVQWRYVPVRRLALYLEASLDRGLAWAAFEPNDERLWSGIRASVESFLFALFQQGALRGASPEDAYFVKCGPETTTPAQAAAGSVIVVVGFAPVKPAEFIILRIEQKTAGGQP